MSFYSHHCASVRSRQSSVEPEKLKSKQRRSIDIYLVTLTMDTRSSATSSLTHAPSHPHRDGMSKPLVEVVSLAVMTMPLDYCSYYLHCSSLRLMDWRLKTKQHMLAGMPRQSILSRILANCWATWDLKLVDRQENVMAFEK